MHFYGDDMMADSSRTKTRTNKKGAGERRLLIDPEQYERHHIKLAIIMGHFTLRHLNMVYQEFEGDLILPIVLGEIAHHNILKFYSQTGEYQHIERIIATDHDWQRHLEPCNAFSISEATGIPRETVRRKVDKLVKKGWLARNARARSPSPRLSDGILSRISTGTFFRNCLIRAVRSGPYWNQKNPVLLARRRGRDERENEYRPGIEEDARHREREFPFRSDVFREAVLKKGRLRL